MSVFSALHTFSPLCLISHSSPAFLIQKSLMHYITVKGDIITSLLVSVPQVQERPDDVDTGSTYIIVDIYYLDSNRQRTSTHSWHVHMIEPVPGQQCAGVIGGHYNPFSVSLGKPLFVFSSYNHLLLTSPCLFVLAVIISPTFNQKKKAYKLSKH